MRVRWFEVALMVGVAAYAFLGRLSVSFFYGMLLVTSILVDIRDNTKGN